jgi:hypothetical protein
MESTGKKHVLSNLGKGSFPRGSKVLQGWNISKHSKVEKALVSESEMSLKFLYTPPFFPTTGKGIEKTLKTVNHVYHSII